MIPIKTYRIEATLVSQGPIKAVYHIDADSEDEAIEEVKLNGNKIPPAEVDFTYSNLAFYDLSITNSFIEKYDYDWDISTNDRHS